MSLDLGLVLVMHRLILLGFLGLAGEHVIWAVGLVLIPFGHPGGGFEGETCNGALAHLVYVDAGAHSTHCPHPLWKGG